MLCNIARTLQVWRRPPVSFFRAQGIHVTAVSMSSLTGPPLSANPATPPRPSASNARVPTPDKRVPCITRGKMYAIMRTWCATQRSTTRGRRSTSAGRRGVCIMGRGGLRGRISWWRTRGGGMGCGEGGGVARERGPEVGSLGVAGGGCIL